MASERPRVDDLGEFLRQQRHHARMTLRQLAARSGVSNPYLSQVERGLRRPSAEVLQQVARALRISSTALYARAGLLDEPPGGRQPGVVAAILTDPALDERQRRVLIDVYTTFVEPEGRAASDTAPDAAGADHPPPDGGRPQPADPASPDPTPESSTSEDSTHPASTEE